MLAESLLAILISFWQQTKENQCDIGAISFSVGRLLGTSLRDECCKFMKNVKSCFGKFAPENNKRPGVFSFPDAINGGRNKINCAREKWKNCLGNGHGGRYARCKPGVCFYLCSFDKAKPFSNEKEIHSAKRLPSLVFIFQVQQTFLNKLGWSSFTARPASNFRLPSSASSAHDILTHSARFTHSVIHPRVFGQSGAKSDG